MPTPTITICMTCRDGARWLPRALHALIPQLGPDCSLVLADDASSDGSPDIAEALTRALAPAGSALILRHPGPGPLGIGGCRDLAASAATGRYVWFHDCDDLLTPSAVRRCLEALPAAGWPDCLSVPVGQILPSGPASRPVAASSIAEAAAGPVGAWSKVIRRRLLAPFGPGCPRTCEDAAWHFRQFDRFGTWARVEGGEPCYLWDRTVPGAVTRTVEWLNANSRTLEHLALSDELDRLGLRPGWVSDNLRNLALMIDLRHSLTRPWVRDAWARRLRAEVAALMSGHPTH